GAVVDRLHQQAGTVDELPQLLAVGHHVLDRTLGDAGVHRGLGHGRGQLDQQARVEWTGDQVFGAEVRDLVAVGAAQVGGFLARRRRDGVHAGDLHLLVDAGRADVQRATEQVGEAQGVVDLVRVVRTAGGDDRVRAHAARVLGQDLRVRVGQGQDHRVGGHGGHHLWLEDAAGRQAQEDVRALDDVFEGAGVGVARIAQLVRVQVGAAGVDHAAAVEGQDVLRAQAQLDQHVHAGDASGAHAGGRQLHVLDLLADHVQGVDHRRADDDRGAVLVVVEHRDVHPLAQLALDDEALRRLDVLEVDAAEGRLQRGDDVDQLVRVV